MAFKISQLLKDRRYVIYYIFTSVTIASLLAIEEFIAGDYTKTSDVVLEFVRDVPFFFLLSLAIGSLANLVILWLDKYYSWEKMSFQRLIYEMSSVLILVAIFTMIFMLGKSFIIFGEDDYEDDSKYQVITMLMFFIAVFMVFSFHEYISLNEDKKEITDVAKDLERQNYISKFEALKNQVNPHFLFNSLNVLSSLIYNDIELSDKFIRKFSEVFRYVLELNNEELVALKKEVDFINSYFFLQKIRHEDAINICMKIKSEDLERYIPPMALQIVIENAFKHNIVTKNNPLTIELLTCDSKLIVKNNYQARKDALPSTGIGQKNLLNRYQMLANSLPEFYIEDAYYFAELPLLDKKD